jgi:hypothetical protein
VRALVSYFAEINDDNTHIVRSAGFYSSVPAVELEGVAGKGKSSSAQRARACGRVGMALAAL